MGHKRQGTFGEFEHLVLLTILRHPDGVFGVHVGRELEDHARRRVSRGALYATLERLERKGCIRWVLEKGGPERGGHPRRKFTLTRTGLTALREYRRAVQSLVLGFEELL